MASVTFNHRLPFKDLGVLSGNVVINTGLAEVFQIRINENVTNLSILGRGNVSLIFLSDNPDLKIYYDGAEIPQGLTQWVNIADQWRFFQPSSASDTDIDLSLYAKQTDIVSNQIDLVAASGSVTLDASKAQLYTTVAKGAVEITVSGKGATALAFTQDAQGNRTLVFNSKTVPVNPNPNSVTFIEFWPNATGSRTANVVSDPSANVAELKTEVEALDSKLTSFSKFTVLTFNGTTWPARPTGNVSITWWDPTGLAPTPPGFVPDIDVWDRAKIENAFAPMEKFSPEIAEFEGGWFAQGSTPQSNLANGQLIMTAPNHKFGAEPVALVPGRRYQLIVSPTAESTGTYQIETRIQGTPDRYPYSWPESPDTQILEFVAEPGDAQLFAYVTWKSGSVTLASASLIERR